jgi:hypothetical protein
VFKSFGLAAMLAVVVFFASSALSPSSCSAEENILRNADLGESVYQSVRYWEHDAWTTEPDGVAFDWLADNHPAELEVSSQVPADARWTQALHPRLTILGASFHRLSMPRRFMASSRVRPSRSIWLPRKV